MCMCVSPGWCILCLKCFASKEEEGKMMCQYTKQLLLKQSCTIKQRRKEETRLKKPTNTETSDRTTELLLLSLSNHLFLLLFEHSMSAKQHLYHPARRRKKTEFSVFFVCPCFSVALTEVMTDLIGCCSPADTTASSMLDFHTKVRTVNTICIWPTLQLFCQCCTVVCVYLLHPRRQTH